MRHAYYTLVFLVVLTVSILGFRGLRSTRPPIEVFPDLDRQAKYRPQAESVFFADGRTDRPEPSGTVARGRTVAADPSFLRADDFLYRGKSGDGSSARGFPVPVTDAFIRRGQERFAIYCQPCHGALGDGNGVTRGYNMNPASFHDDRLRQMPEGELFNTITNGKNTMMSYADKLTSEDRWAVVAYLRALQRAAHATLADVPAEHRSNLK
ncbi:MAG: cytochrome c [Opitutaceae bacterium]|nr:cytochrome c [Opitutaceae bacterium]